MRNVSFYKAESEIFNVFDYKNRDIESPGICVLRSWGFSISQIPRRKQRGIKFESPQGAGISL